MASELAVGEGANLAWWRDHAGFVRQIEEGAFLRDPSIRRLVPFELDRNPDLRETFDRVEDLLAYEAPADGPFGSFRLVATFPWPLDVGEPAVLCLDGPRGPEASEHRIGSIGLCLYFPGDRPERRWKTSDRLDRLFYLGRRHLFGEFVWREEGQWPFAEAPHGNAALPASPAPHLLLPPPHLPRRNELCPCGSKKKFKKCHGGVRV